MQNPTQFHPTRWSMVLSAREHRTREGEEALTWLCERYWQPLVIWAQFKGLARADAEDLVQGFFANALPKGLVGNASPTIGRFRSYLLGSLEHHWIDLRRRREAEKRGGGTATLSLDLIHSEISPDAPPADTRTPAEEFDRAWAVAILDRCMTRLAEECDAADHTGRFAVLRVFLEGDKGELSLADAAAALQLTLPALKSAVHRLRRRLAELVRQEVAETVPTANEVDAEMDVLFAALRG